MFSDDGPAENDSERSSREILLVNLRKLTRPDTVLGTVKKSKIANYTTRNARRFVEKLF